MPDASGNFRGITVPAAAWERIFGTKQEPGPERPGCGRPDCRTCRDFADDEAGR